MTVIWGVQSRFYDPVPRAELFYEAEDLTPLGGAATAARKTLRLLGRSVAPCAPKGGD